MMSMLPGNKLELNVVSCFSKERIIPMTNSTIDWLLEDSNYAVQYRTKTEILDEYADVQDAKMWIFGKLPDNWHETRGIWFVYYITALAECGLSYKDIPIEYMNRAFDDLVSKFNCSCSDFMLLRALIKLGFSTHDTVRSIIGNLEDYCLTDGGFLCIKRKNKLSYSPKSCYIANLQALLLAAECKKQNVECSFVDKLVQYFIAHKVFYRTDSIDTLILNGREGWRAIDIFYPFEPLRVGIQNIVEAFCALGFGNEDWLSEAWNILNSHKDTSGKIVLQGTLSKSYLPKERIGKPSKWATFYALLAEKQR